MENTVLFAMDCRRMMSPLFLLPSQGKIKFKMTKCKEIITRFYKYYVKKYLKKIFIALVLSLFVAGSTASIAWLLDPAIKKIFIEKDEGLKFLIPLAIIVAFSLKGLSLYLVRITVASVGIENEKELRDDMSDTIINADTQTLDNKHTGKFSS